jgi:hypothetical protein
MPSNIQAVLFDIQKFNEKDINDWLKKNNFKKIKKIHKTKKYLRVRIVDPKRFKKFRIKKTKTGIDFIIGFY